MPDDERPQICLITPPAPDLALFPDRLARLLDRHPIACLRLALGGEDETAIARMTDALREVAHSREVAIVIADHVLLVERHGLDGVHLSDGRRPVRKLRADLGADAIIGAFCGITRHDGIAAAEAGADYVAFGPVGDTGLGDGSMAPHDLFAWWSEMIEVPVIAEGGLTPAWVEALAPVTDFFAIGPEIWSADEAGPALDALLAPLG